MSYKEMEKAYDPAANEDRIYSRWEESGYFNPDNLNLPETAPAYTIVLPPPNITAKLHLGHASTIAIEDLLIRHRRLNGYRALWLPGTDHAAIATQNVVEKKIFQESKQTRHDLGREKFLEKVWEFLRETQTTILNQTRKMGASLDWSRTAFTLDEQREKAVRRMFKDMYEAGAIYRGERIVNWCPRCHSTLADDEVEYKETPSKLYWINYGPFLLATSRPETKLGDTAVAVHPSDPRYKDLIGKELDIDGVLGKFKVIVVADYAVDMEFGGGAIKVTPAHSFIDNEIAQRHNLPSKKIIDEDGKMMANCGKYAGLTTKEAREAIVADMQSLGLIHHIDENYTHNASVCYRCGTMIEPLPSKQWFVAVDKKLERLNNKSLKEAAIEAAEKSEINFIPERFTKRYLDWMKNLHDWCISRQIWFGHRIPVWYCNDHKNPECSEPIISESAPEKCPHCGGQISQDPDTLDTWFSSGMWTFSTLGWPDNFKDGVKSGDLAKFHPTQMLETGYEIITLWVSRMIMMSLFAIGEIPFSNVYLHGMILDKNGKKMSKSKGNGIDPIEVIEKFGTDAVRLSLLIGNTPGNDMRFGEERIESARNFINKLWNVSRFILQKTNGEAVLKIDLTGEATAFDKWIINEYEKTLAGVNDDLNNYRFALAGDKLQEFTWNKLADWYLEVSKFESNQETKNKILSYLLKNILILWHSFTPFVTEVIWESLSEGDNNNLLMVAKWPQSQNKIDDSQEEISTVGQTINIIEKIRNARSENKIEPAKKIKAVIYAGKNCETLKAQATLIKSLKTGIEELTIEEKGEKIDGAILIPCGEMEIYLIGAIDEAKEKERVAKEKANLEKMISSLKAKLNNEEFVSKAPEAVVNSEKERLAKYETELEKIKSN